MSFRHLVFLLLYVFISACSPQESENSKKTEVIHLGVLPDESTAVLQKKYSTLVSFLKKETELDYQLVIPASYHDLLEAFIAEEIDIAYFGAVTFLTARQANGAEPLVSRDVDNRFTSVILVAAKSNAKNLEDLKGASFSFGSRLSTSGHLMPRYFFNDMNITPEEFFGRVMYSGSHDETVKWVKNGKTDAGAVNAVIVKRMLENGRLKRDEIKILWESTPYQDYIWAIQKNIPAGTKSTIRDAFLSLTIGDPKQKEILAEIGANYFLPARMSDFNKLQSIMDGMPKP